MPLSATKTSTLPDLSTGLAARLACRSGAVTGATSGMAPGFVQGNLAVLPRELAYDFLAFCRANPKPCPVIGISEPGDPRVPALGEDLDLRTDIPGYRIWENGKVVAEVSDASAYWRDDLVAFVLGCSYSFEDALIENGLKLRHVERNSRVPMFRTTIPCTPSGVFSGPMVVSMRPLKPADAIRAIQITSRFPAVHGAPVHIGLPELIGIKDITKPDYGDPVEVLEGELPVFWACGVTPQSIIDTVRPSFAITHAPGAMLITDRQNSEFAII